MPNRNVRNDSVEIGRRSHVKTIGIEHRPLKPACAIVGAPGGRALPFPIYREMFVLELLRHSFGLLRLDLFRSGI